MKTLIKLLVALVVVAGVAYFAFFVPLGHKTLWGHMVGISKTQEAKTLEKELEKKVKKTAKGVTAELKSKAGDLAEVKDKIAAELDEAKKDDEDSDDEKHSEPDKQALKELVQNKTEPSESDRQALNKLVKQKNSGKID